MREENANEYQKAKAEVKAEVTAKMEAKVKLKTTDRRRKEK